MGHKLENISHKGIQKKIIPNERKKGESKQDEGRRRE
jgi:hypothetical protein